MYLRRLIYSDFGKIIISVLLGLGLSTLFRKVCNDRNCLVFKAPAIDKIDDKTYKFENKCYKYKAHAIECKNDSEYIEFE
jgi:hypothetical protein